MSSYIGCAYVVLSSFFFLRFIYLFNGELLPDGNDTKQTKINKTQFSEACSQVIGKRSNQAIMIHCDKSVKQFVLQVSFLV